MFRRNSVTNSDKEEKSKKKGKGFKQSLGIGQSYAPTPELQRPCKMKETGCSFTGTSEELKIHEPMCEALREHELYSKRSLTKLQEDLHTVTETMKKTVETKAKLQEDKITALMTQHKELRDILSDQMENIKEFTSNYLDLQNSLSDQVENIQSDTSIHLKEISEKLLRLEENIQSEAVRQKEHVDEAVSRLEEDIQLEAALQKKHVTEEVLKLEEEIQSGRGELENLSRMVDNQKHLETIKAEHLQLKNTLSGEMESIKSWNKISSVAVTTIVGVIAIFFVLWSSVF